MKTFTIIPLGSDATKLAGYAVRASGRLGSVAITFAAVQTESPTGTAAGTQYVKVQQLTSSGYTNLISGFTVPQGGQVNKLATLPTSTIGFFGSGGGKVAVTIEQSLPGTQLHGGDIQIEIVGRKNFGYDTGVDSAQFPGLNPAAPLQ